MKASSLAVALLTAFAATACAQSVIPYVDTQNRTTPIELTGGEVVNLAITLGTATQSGLISGDGSIAKVGEGTLVFTFNEAYSGATSVNGGILQIGDATHEASLSGLSSSTGDGQTAAFVSAGGTLNNAVLGTIRGGEIVPGPLGEGTGRGGVGVDLLGGVLNNYGSIIGGKGISSKGGEGVIVRSGGVFNNAGTVTGGGMFTFAGPESDTGGAGVIVSAGATFTNTGTIRGGSSASSISSIPGGAGLILDSHEDVTLGGTIIGGDGSMLAFTAARGGTGAEVTLSAGKNLTNSAHLEGGKYGLGLKVYSAASVTNQGTITGGIQILNAASFLNEATITGYTAVSIPSEQGGTGADLILTSGATFSDSSVITGGIGSKEGLSAGNGGTGLILSAQGNVSNSGDIIGGAGGVSISSGNRGRGGKGAVITLAADADFTNHGTIAGGDAAAVALQVNSARTVTNHATISGTVAIQSTQNLDNHGTIDGGVTVTGAISLTHTGSITGSVVLSNLANQVTLHTESVIGGDLYVGTDPGSTLTLDGSGTSVYSSAVEGTTTFSGSLVKQGAGAWTLDAGFSHAGMTTVREGSLLVEGGSLGDVTVESGAIFGGGGILDGNLIMDAGSYLAFDPTGTLSITGSVSLDSSFGIARLYGLDSSVALGTYLLIDGTSTDFSSLGLQNWGAENAYHLGGNKYAYFKEGSLELEVIPEPSTCILILFGGAMGLAAWKRGRIADLSR